MDAAVNCFVIEPSRNFVAGVFGNVPFEVRRSVALAEDDVAAAGDEHRPHEGLVADVGLHDLLHARRVLRKARARDEEEHERASDGFHAQELTAD